MRILQVNKFLYPKGGAEVVCLGLSDLLREAGHEVFHFGMKDPRNLETSDEDCFPENVDYHGDRSLAQKAREAMRTIYGKRARDGMARILDRRRPDLIHAHNIYHQLTPSILGPARARGIPVMLTLHDYKLLCPVYTFLREGRVCELCLQRGGPEPILARRCKGGSMADSLVLWAEDRLHRVLSSYEKGVNLFTSPSRFLREKMIEGRIPAGKIDYLPNFLPFPEQLLQEPFIPPGDGVPTLFWAGRMSAEKGLETLLHALSGVRAPLRLLLAGDGPLEGKLRALALQLKLGESVEFLGRVDRESMPALIRKAHGTILPSEWYENAPMAILESLAMGRPVLASSVGGVPEMIVDGETGWLFPSGDRQSLRERLESWSGSLAHRAEFGERAFRDARERFHPHRVLEMTLERYERLLGK